MEQRYGVGLVSIVLLVVIALAVVPQIVGTPPATNTMTVTASPDGSTATLSLDNISLTQETTTDVYDNRSVKTLNASVDINVEDIDKQNFRQSVDIQRVTAGSGCGPQLPRLQIQFQPAGFSITNMSISEPTFESTSYNVTPSSCVAPPVYNCQTTSESQGYVEPVPPYPNGTPCPDPPDIDGTCSDCHLNQTVPSKMIETTADSSSLTEQTIWLARYDGEDVEKLESATINWDLLKHVPKDRRETLFLTETDVTTLFNTSSARISREIGDTNPDINNEQVIQTGNTTIRQQLYHQDGAVDINRTQCSDQMDGTCFREFGHRNIRVRIVVFSNRATQEQLREQTKHLETFMKERIDTVAFEDIDTDDTQETTTEPLEEEQIYQETTEQDCTAMMESFQANLSSCSATQDRYNCGFQAIHYIPELAERCPRDAAALCQQRNDILASRDSGQTLESSYQGCLLDVAEQVYDENITAAIEHCKDANERFSCSTRVAENVTTPGRIAVFNKSRLVGLCEDQSSPDRELCYSSIGHLFTMTNKTRAQQYCEMAEETTFTHNSRSCQIRMAQILMYHDPSEAQKHCEQLDATGTTECFRTIDTME